MLKWNKGDVIHREAPFIAMLTKDNIKQYCSYGLQISRILISREEREILSHFSRETRKK